MTYIMLKRTKVKKIKIGIIVLENSLISAVTGLDDIFSICNVYCKHEDEAEIIISYLALDKNLNFSKLSLKTQRIEEKDSFDIIIIPPILSEKTLLIQPSLSKYLVKMYHKGTVLTAACAGSFILAQTGLLDYKKATTHWLFESLFLERFPNVMLHTDKILIDEGELITAGGISAYIDLALYLIEKNLSLQSANKCASLLLVDRGRESQTCYKDLNSTLLVEDKEIKNLLLWMKKNLEKKLTTKSLSLHIGLQERSFIRRFKSAVQTTPVQYLQNLRIEKAKSLLMSSKKSFEDITYEVGFNNESSFRRLFKKKTSLNPGEYRKKFKFS